MAVLNAGINSLHFLHFTEISGDNCRLNQLPLYSTGAQQLRSHLSLLNIGFKWMQSYCACNRYHSMEKIPELADTGILYDSIGEIPGDGKERLPINYGYFR